MWHCNVCQLEFDSQNDLDQHRITNFHARNQILARKGEPPITLQQYAKTLTEQHKQLFQPE